MLDIFIQETCFISPDAGPATYHKYFVAYVWSLMPTITSEIFGVLHMGTIFNAITIAAPVGSYIFSVRVIGYIYDKEASTAWNTCTGTHCFRLSFLIMACATFLGSLTE
ncbi:unnamed protein product [Prunus armeniaca]|uniref:NFD4 C-terminal domain-containing protein n=1 Tax=Prunus armeniaca TaxID=36596 RepID=A0A6J5UY03_PRUAR|nr:unnamed protein product [Prunus armeniaca]